MLDIAVKKMLLKIAHHGAPAPFQKICFVYYEQLLKLACPFMKITEVIGNRSILQLLINPNV